MATKFTALARDGVRVAAAKWPTANKTAPNLLFAHATGFCKEVWDPCIQDLKAQSKTKELPGDAYTFDFRGQGDTIDPSPTSQAWSQGALDLLAVVDKVKADSNNGEKFLGVGHSFGATSLILAEAMQPGTFSGLVLAEPVIFPWLFSWPTRAPFSNPLVTTAAKRKGTFRSREEAHENFASKKIFSKWDPRALEGYVQGGTTDITPEEIASGTIPEGHTVRLKCTPFYESTIFGLLNDSRGKLKTLTPPITFITGGSSHHLKNATRQAPKDYFAGLAKMCTKSKHAQHVVLDGLSHFLVQERPDLIAKEVLRFLENEMLD